MKTLLTILFTTLIISVFGQSKNNYILFNKLTELKGSNYVIASISNMSKVSTGTTNNEYLLFINTSTGDTNKVKLSEDADIFEIKQVKIDSLDINKVVVRARTVDLDGKGNISWSDPMQIIVLSTDGKQKTQLTDNRLFVRAWTVSYNTGTIVVTGHYDSNNNKKYDKRDKSEILIFDLKTLQLKSKI